MPLVTPFLSCFSTVYPSNLSLENSSSRKSTLHPNSKFGDLALCSQGIWHLVSPHLPLWEFNSSLSLSIIFLPDYLPCLMYEQFAVRDLVLLITFNQQQPGTLVLGTAEPSGHSLCFHSVYMLGVTKGNRLRCYIIEFPMPGTLQIFNRCFLNG